MSNWLLMIPLFLAEEKAAPNPLQSMIIPMIAVTVLGYFLLFRPEQRAQKRKELLDSLKKNDRVVTIGGILGTVVKISQDGQEVTLRTDDNTKIQMLRKGIQSVQQPENQKQESAS